MVDNPGNNPLARAIRLAERANDDLARITARYGGTERNPRGHILRAYRVANSALKSALSGAERGSADISAIRDILLEWRLSVEAATASALNEAAVLGTETASRQLVAYDFIPVPMGGEMLFQQSALEAVMSEVERQDRAASALVIGGAALALIVGDRARVGVLRAAPVVRDVATWSARVAAQTFTQVLQRTAPEERFRKQAIAALDERTTDCCLRIHGQIRDIEQDYWLEGVPRFADALPAPPFHWYCRTSQALYLEAFDFGLTERMRSAADEVMAEREEGRSGYRHPATALGG